MNNKRIHGNFRKLDDYWPAIQSISCWRRENKIKNEKPGCIWFYYWHQNWITMVNHVQTLDGRAVSFTDRMAISDLRWIDGSGWERMDGETCNSHLVTNGRNWLQTLKTASCGLKRARMVEELNDPGLQRKMPTIHGSSIYVPIRTIHQRHHEIMNRAWLSLCRANVPSQESRLPDFGWLSMSHFSM